MTNRRRTYAQRRHRAEARKGWTLITLTALAFAAMLYGAYAADQARGISVSASLQGWGL